ncbi:unnamed protein product [Gulo gulo]|uniref:Cytochrome c oxidase subunit 7A1, mitochondrial n=1 Tax=Gulo gulo TaxID=48420 RepID=A0A9X9Q1E3_GULGU|nr:unnamed protein product [Gulo gulo]
MAQRPGLSFFPSSRAPLTPRDLGRGNLTPLLAPCPVLLRQYGNPARHPDPGRIIPGTWASPVNLGNPPHQKSKTPPSRDLKPQIKCPFWVSQALVRSFSSTTRNRFQNRVAEKQKLFQADNDLPVHLKGGGTDNILYRVTMGLCVGGTVYSLYCLGWASFPHQK